MQTLIQPSLSRAAVVAKQSGRPGDLGLYLSLADDGRVAWIDDPAAATAFDSMREATRACLRLPGALRAYALPRDVECDVRAHDGDRVASAGFLRERTRISPIEARA